MKWQVWVWIFEAPGWYLLRVATKVAVKRTCLLHKNGELQESKSGDIWKITLWCLWTVRRHLCALSRCGLFLELCSFLPNHCCVVFRRCLHFLLHALSCAMLRAAEDYCSVLTASQNLDLRSTARLQHWLDLMLVQANISSTSPSSYLSALPVLCFWDHFRCKRCRQTLLSDYFSTSVPSTDSTWNLNQVVQPAGQQRDS